MTTGMGKTTLGMGTMIVDTGKVTLGKEREDVLWD